MNRLLATSAPRLFALLLAVSFLASSCEPEPDPKNTGVTITTSDMQGSEDMRPGEDMPARDSGADEEDMAASTAPDADMAPVVGEDMAQPEDMSSGDCMVNGCEAGFSCDAARRCVWSGGAASLVAGDGGDFAPPPTTKPDEVNGPSEPLGILSESSAPLAVSACPEGSVAIGAEVGFGTSDRDGIEDNLLKFRLICQRRMFSAPVVGDVVEASGSESLASDFDFGTPMVFAEHICGQNEVLVGLEARTMNTGLTPFEINLSCAEVYLDDRGAPRARNHSSSGWLDEGGCDRALAAAGATLGAETCVERGSATCIKPDHFVGALHVVREDGIDRDHASKWQVTCRPLQLER
ncbi:MAG: hypothetical protein VYE40_06605 [Myxococcota bacterium]|nr:hypothetical protein [Myxococcota bacterium]